MGWSGSSDASGMTGAISPPPTDGLVARHRLLDRLDRAPAGALLWVAGGPGSGKTALAATWARRRSPRLATREVLWCAMEESDTDALRFFATVGHFLGLPHGFGTTLSSRPDMTALDDIGGAMRQWLQAGRARGDDRPRLLVFDDIHRTPDDSLIVALLPVLAARLGPKDRVLCLSRRRPRPSAASALEAAPIVLIDDLEVEGGEFEDFTRDLPGGQMLSREMFLTALRRSGGWVSEIQASAWALLLPEGVAAAETAADRRALLATAFLQAGEEADWMALGGAGAAEVMGRLADTGALAVRRPGEGIRKHDAFHARLIGDAEAELPADALDAARRKAAHVLAGRRQVLAAARLLMACGAGEAAARLVLENASWMSRSGHGEQLEEAIGLLPAVEAARPLAQVWLAYARMVHEPREARRRLKAIRQSLRPDAFPNEYGLALSGEARGALTDVLDFQELPRLVEEIDLALPKLEAALPDVRQALVLSRCMALLIGWPDHPEVDGARAHIETALPLMPDNLRLIIGGALINYLIWLRGDPAAARPFLTHLEGLARAPDMATTAVMAWYGAALGLAHFDGDDDRLRRLTDEIVAFAGHRRVSPFLTHALWVITQAHAAGGDRQAAALMLERYVTHAQRNWRRTEFMGMHHLRAIVALCAGDTAAGVVEAKLAFDYARRHGGPHQVANQCQLLATALAIGGDSAARAHIEELRQVAGLTGNAMFRLHADLAEAFLASALGHDVATPWMRVADAATRLGLRRITGMNRPRLAELANRALEQGADALATRRVIALWDLPPPRGVIDEQWPFSVEIQALGGFLVKVDGAPIAMGTSKAQRKPLELLWSLMASPAAGVAQDVLIDQIWPQVDGDYALHSLRTTLYRLRKRLGAEAIFHGDDHVGLAADQVRTDVGRLRALIETMRAPDALTVERLQAFDQALRLYRGPLLPGVRLPSVTAARERIEADLVMEGIELLLTLDPRAPAVASRLRQLRAIAPSASWSADIRAAAAGAPVAPRDIQ